MEDYIVRSFDEAIGLRVSYRGKAQLCSYLHTKLLEYFAVKLGSVVYCEFSWHFEAAYDLLPEAFFDSLRGYCGEWLGFYPFGEVLDGNHRIAEVAWSGW